jgi:hypothetical protein
MATLNRRAGLFLVLAILSGCAATQPAVDEGDRDWNIESGYSPAILDRLREIIEVQSSESRQDVPTPARAWATALRQTVWEYNVESANMCAKGLSTRLSCLPALAPPWLTESPKASPTEKELERRSDWLQEHVGRLWDAACEDFKKSHPDSDDYMGYCSIE